jgi:hypothetical protein
MEYKFRKATINDFDFIFNLKKQNFNELHYQMEIKEK